MAKSPSSCGKSNIVLQAPCEFAGVITRTPSSKFCPHVSVTCSGFFLLPAPF